MFENSGQLTVLKKRSEQDRPIDDPSHTLVGDGKIIGYQLEELDKDKNWLEDALAGIDKQIGDIYFTEWNAEKGRHIQDYNGRLYDYDELNFHENPEKSGSFLCW